MKKRIRRTPEEAKRLIVAAALERLARTGPEGLRLQDIAADAGLSHPSILHHFGSREGLVRALVRESVEELKERLLAAIAAPEDSTEAMLAQVSAAFRGGLAQRLAWLRTVQPDSGHEPSAIMRQLADVLHARREAAAGHAIDRADTEALIYLIATASFGDAMFGTQLRRSAGTPESPEADTRYRAWLAGLLRQHLLR